MVTAIATYYMPTPDTPADQRPTDREIHEASAEAGTWEAAQAACAVPDGAQVMHWIRG